MLALLERGGPSSVDNPEAWLTTVARNFAIENYRQSMRERRALAEFHGVEDRLSADFYEVERERWREAHAKRDPIKRNARERANYAAKGGTAHWTERKKEQMRAARRRWYHKNKAAKALAAA